MKKGEKRSANVITPDADNELRESLRDLRQQMALAYSIFQETMDEIERETKTIEEDEMIDSE